MTQRSYIHSGNSTPAPGSPEAVAAGCTCLRQLEYIIDNRQPWGWRVIETYTVWHDSECPLHGQPASAEQETKE